MSTIENVSIIDAVITEAAGKKTAHGTLSALVQHEKHDSVLNRIAMAFDSLQKERQNLSILDKEDNTRRAKEMSVKPEQFLSFMQTTMNQACWATRRLIRAAQQQGQRDDAQSADFTSARDFSEDVSEGLNVAASQSVEALLSNLIDDYTSMINVQAWLASKMDYLDDVDSLYLYADTQKEGEYWVMKDKAVTWDMAVSVMDNVIVQMREREDGKTTEEAASMDFAATA